MVKIGGNKKHKLSKKRKLNEYRGGEFINFAEIGWEFINFMNIGNMQYASLASLREMDATENISIK